MKDSLCPPVSLSLCLPASLPTDKMLSLAQILLLLYFQKVSLILGDTYDILWHRKLVNLTECYARSEKLNETNCIGVIGAFIVLDLEPGSGTGGFYRSKVDPAECERGRRDLGERKHRPGIRSERDQYTRLFR